MRIGWMDSDNWTVWDELGKMWLQLLEMFTCNCWMRESAAVFVFGCFSSDSSQQVLNVFLGFFFFAAKKNPPDGFWWNLMVELQAPGRQRKHWGVEFRKFSDVAFSFLPTSSSVGEVKSKTSRGSFPSFTLKRDSSILFFLFIMSVGSLDIQLLRVDSYLFFFFMKNN